jgi:hypothetical protein
MVKYSVENKINFYEELEKSLNSKEIIVDNQKCLITNDILTDKFIELKCGHCFNYLPLWNEVYNQKFAPSFQKASNLKNSIQCPYCRQIHNYLLPYYPEFNLKLTYGVTSDDVNYTIILYNNEWVYANTLKYFYGKCEFINESTIECDKTNVLYYENHNKTYCCKHLNFIKLLEIKEKKLKEKEEMKQQKLKEKEELKQQKLKEKEEMKQNNKLNKFNKNISPIENIDIDINLNLSKCNYIFKKGINKNTQCRCKLFNNNFCKKHTSTLIPNLAILENEI